MYGGFIHFSAMNRKAKNVLLIGLDGVMYYFVERLVEEGLLPNIGRLMEEGVSGEALPCPPTDTPTNWTTIATGASTATHGVTSFYIHIPGEPYELGQKLRSRGQLSRYCKAEYIWEVADRQGISSLILNYPAGWPGRMKNGYVCLYTWPTPESTPRILAGRQEYRLEDGVPVELPFPSKPSYALKFSMEVGGGFIEGSKTVDLYVVQVDGSRYRLALPRSKGYELIDIGDWSSWIGVELKVRAGGEWNVKTLGGTVRGVFKLKLLEASSTSIRILRSEVFSVEGWIDPGGLEEDVIRNTHYLRDEEPLAEFTGRLEYDISGVEAEYLAKQRVEAYRIARIAGYFKRITGWRLCFLHYHLMDGVNHRLLGFLDSDFPFYEEEKAEYAWRRFVEAYRIVDEFVGLLLDSCVTPDTLIVVVSDHAAVPAWRTVNIRKIFVDEGLLQYKPTPNGYLVDWSRTKAFPWVEPLMVWVNLKGRDPNGIVERREYEDVRGQVIDILQGMRDPDTGERITTMVASREESVNLGLGDERTGDVVYFLRPPYTIWCGPIEDLLTYMAADRHLDTEWFTEDQSRITGIHGYYLPNVKVGEFSNSSLLIMKGPGVKRGEELRKPVRLMDIAPTISYLLGIPVPRNSEGRVIHEALE